MSRASSRSRQRSAEPDPDSLSGCELNHIFVFCDCRKNLHIWTSNCSLFEIERDKLLEVLIIVESFFSVRNINLACHVAVYYTKKGSATLSMGCECTFNEHGLHKNELMQWAEVNGL